MARAGVDGIYNSIKGLSRGGGRRVGPHRAPVRCVTLNYMPYTDHLLSSVPTIGFASTVARKVAGNLTVIK